MEERVPHQNAMLSSAIDTPCKAQHQVCRKTTHVGRMRDVISDTNKILLPIQARQTKTTVPLDSNDGKEWRSAFPIRTMLNSAVNTSCEAQHQVCEKTTRVGRMREATS